MTPVRAGVALLLIAIVCLTVVALRVERVRLEAGAEGHLTTLIELRRRAWNMQMEIARLRAPEQIRDRVERLDLRVGATFQNMMRADTSERRFAANSR